MPTLYTMNRSKCPILLKLYVILAAALPACASEYPGARRSDHVDTYFGTPVADPYRWMEEIDSPETTAWVAAEREHTAQALAAMPEIGPIRERFTRLWDFPKFEVPVKRAGRFFYRSNKGLQNQSVLYVADGEKSEGRALIDPNGLAADGTAALVEYSPSHDGSLVAYEIARAGSDWVEIHVRQVATGADLPDAVRWVKFSGISWTHDGKGFFYSRYPEPPEGKTTFAKLEARQLLYHRLGTDQSQDLLVFEDKAHPDRFFGGGVSDDGRYLVIEVELNTSTSTALYYADLGDPSSPDVRAPVVRLLDKFDAEYSFVGNLGRDFFVQTTLSSPRGRVVEIDLDRPAGPWKTPVPESEDSIEDSGLIGGKLVTTYVHDAHSRMSVHAADGADLGDVALPGIGSISGVSGQADDPELFYGFSSFLTPPSIFERNLSTGEAGVFRSPSVAFDASRYETKEAFVPSKDGTRVPIFITARKGVGPGSNSALWLYGYGGFNISILPSFTVAQAVWLEMGGTYVQAVLRGGGEYGQAWHLAGTRERKQNVFDDFIAAADYLVAKGYTSRDRLVIEGRSNGGLLIGAVLNQRPDLCAVALPGVGVMDMLRYHKFTIGANWASDYGTSDDEAGFRYLRAYSPVHNVRTGVRYPPVFITTGDHDDRVYPAHSFKYAAAMQHEASLVPGSGPVLIRIEHNAGHGGSSGSSPVSKTIDEWADKMGFAAHYLPKGSLSAPPRP
jgi:prolyl oligopeptidase